jgi:hypothetical protein
MAPCWRNVTGTWLPEVGNFRIYILVGLIYRQANVIGGIEDNVGRDTVAVIMNRDSGTAKRRSPRNQAAFAAYGWQVEFVLAGRRDLRSRTQQTVAETGAIAVLGRIFAAIASACVEESDHSASCPLER